MNSMPDASKAARTAFIVEDFKASPLSKRATVSGEILASFAKSLVPHPRAARAILH